MDKFLSRLLDQKTVAVWGSGYLAYTTILTLQSKGFKTVLYDLPQSSLELLKDGSYPTQDQVVAWSKTNSAPSLKFEFIEVAKTPERLFEEDISLHIVAFPYSNRDKPKHKLLLFKEIFEKHATVPEKTPPLVFLSAGCPGELQRHFISFFEEYEICTAFRNDWLIEEFLSNRHFVTVASNRKSAFDKLEKFYGMLDIKTFPLQSIKEAETFENARNTLYYVISTTLSQLSLAYPTVDFKEMSPLLLANMDLSLCSLSAGIGGSRMPFAVEKLLEGSKYSHFLSILKEAQAVNISSIISYSEYLARKGFKKVAILGLSSDGNVKLPAMSPSVNLAELLIRQGLEVGIQDPFFPAQEIKTVIPKASVIEGFKQLAEYQVVIVMNDHDSYRFLGQSDIDKYLNGKVKMVIDNHGIWSSFTFTDGTVYHALGDGNFSIME